MLSSEEKVLIKNLWECERYSARRLMKVFPKKMRKDVYWTIFGETCEPSLRSNAL